VLDKLLCSMAIRFGVTEYCAVPCDHAVIQVVPTCIPNLHTHINIYRIDSRGVVRHNRRIHPDAIRPIEAPVDRFECTYLMGTNSQDLLFGGVIFEFYSNRLVVRAQDVSMTYCRIMKLPRRMIVLDGSFAIIDFVTDPLFKMVSTILNNHVPKQIIRVVYYSYSLCNNCCMISMVRTTQSGENMHSLRYSPDYPIMYYQIELSCPTELKYEMGEYFAVDAEYIRLIMFLDRMIIQFIQGNGGTTICELRAVGGDNRGVKWGDEELEGSTHQFV
jgi:hypothetical protein